MAATIVKKNVIVTGGDGFCAKALIDLLSEKSEYNGIPLSLTTSTPEQIQQTLLQSTPAAIFLVPPPTPASLGSLQTLFETTLQLESSPHTILISSVAAYFPKTTLGHHYSTIEQSLLSSLTNYTILRPTPLQQRFLALTADFHQPIPQLALPISTGSLSPINACDIASVSYHIITNPTPHNGHTYTLTGPDLLTGVEIAGKASLGLDRPVSFRNCSAAQARSHLLSSHHTLVDHIMELYALVSHNRYAIHTHTVEDITGRRPIPLEQFFDDNKKAFNRFDIKKTGMKGERRNRDREDEGFVEFVGGAYRGSFGAGLGRYVLAMPLARL